MGDAQIGLKHWEATRLAWQTIPAAVTPEILAARRAKGMLFPATRQDGSGGPLEEQMSEVYEKAVVQGKRLRRNINLSCLMPCLKYGWIKQGFWPSDGRDPETTS
ncbi:hypothetical protein BCR37DRAFT_382031 [Protomyces lactucae-debilis]|uniref:Gag1-like clamp domain-containing protein n=1 Tax=Protomyces lactucae-debilis TaxID=2754530 RepID=A0A1Y2F809_PROLT|nr:uncharacterized protein BCR37DRAFT_382031 [Protomyces lactucae-debilis]ORY79055.1 hypothetical protein BCR37DRAFT_382031 [Protomyces lactucae-debilis]